MLSLVPRFLVERLAAGRSHGSVPGAALYVDIVGFTAMGDALREAGPHGAETVADTVQSVMVPIVEAVHHQAGFVAAFAGDAVMALFPADGSSIDPSTRAVAAAETLQTAIHAVGPRRTPYGPVEIVARAGVGAGQISWTVLSSSDGHRRTYAFAGSAATAAVAAEQRSRPGEVTVPPGLHRGRLHDEVVRQQTATSLPDSELERWAADFVDPALVPDLRAGEFRPVTTAFVATPVDQLARVVTDVFELQERFGGVLDPIEIGDKGCVIRLFWGAPVRHEGDDARCQRFGYELARRHPGVRIGMTTGIAYAGFVGTEDRLGFITYGSHVNLAARLMTLARPGEVLLAGQLASQATRLYALRSHGTHQLKGFSLPVEVLAQAEPTPAAASVGAYVGRVDELAALENLCLEGAGLAVVHGPPGIGKSALLAEVRRRTPAVHWVAARADPVWREPLQPLREIAAQLLDQPGGPGHIVDEERLADTLDELGLVEHRRALAAFLGLHRPDDAEPLDPDGRRRHLQAALTALLQASCSHQRLVVQIDDVHWSDRETLALLPQLLPQLRDRQFVLVLTTRDAEAVAGLPSALDLVLDRLDVDALARLAERLLGERVAPTTVTWLGDRTAGNPFFVHQVLLHLRDRGQLVTTPDGLQVSDRAGSVPPSVGAVVVARLDGLPRELRAVVTSASVFGSRLEIDELRGLLRRRVGSARESDLDAAVATGGELGLWQQSGSLIEFSHALVRDAAYETMLVARRRRLNAAAAETIEELHAIELGPHLHRLARHHEAAGDTTRARRRERQAADRALSLGAYHEAGAFAAAGLAIDAAALVIEPRSETAPETADIGTATDPSEDVLGLWLDLGASRMVTHGQGAAETKQAYDQAAALAGQATDTRAGFRALFGLRTFYLFRGDHPRSLEMAQRALAMAERLNDPDLLQQAHLMVGNACFWMGQLDSVGHHLGQVLESDVLVGHATHRAAFAQDPRITGLVPAALTRWLLGDRNGALQQAVRALDTELDEFGTATVLQVVGFLHCLDGWAAEARRAADRLVRVSQQHHFRVNAEIGAVQLGWAEVRLGQPESGLARMIAARDRMHAAGTQVGGTLVAVLLADALWHAGRASDALLVAGDAIVDGHARRELAFVGLLADLRTAIRGDLDRTARGSDAESAARKGQSDEHPEEAVARGSC